MAFLFYSEGNMKDIAINSINKAGKEHNLDIEDKLITVCEFISSQDLDKELEMFLMSKFTEN